MWARYSACDGQIMALRANCGKKDRKEPSNGADHHGSKIATRSKERWKSRGSPHAQPHHGHTCDNGNGNDEFDGMALVVMQRSGSRNNRGWNANGCEDDGTYPDAPSEMQRPTLDVAFGFQSEVKGSVERNCGKGQHAAKD